jgi:hypothetical protein
MYLAEDVFGIAHLTEDMALAWVKDYHNFLYSLRRIGHPNDGSLVEQGPLPVGNWTVERDVWQRSVHSSTSEHFPI